VDRLLFLFLLVVVFGWRGFAVRRLLECQFQLVEQNRLQLLFPPPLLAVAAKHLRRANTGLLFKEEQLCPRFRQFPSLVLELAFLLYEFALLLGELALLLGNLLLTLCQLRMERCEIGIRRPKE
jgi:hypothetical protein